MNYSGINTDSEVARILRVDHAGEKGAIEIYKAQARIAKVLYPELEETLRHMLEHEISHFTVFDELLAKRQLRSCYSLFLWSIGGTLLGYVTALLGRRAIGVTTDAVESTVLHHLDWQLAYLEATDTEAYSAVSSIHDNEIEHRDWGRGLGNETAIYSPIRWMVSGSTKFAIWLSTKL